jgi:hypothetical protein
MWKCLSVLVHRADSGQCATMVDDDQNNQSLCKIASISRGLRKMRIFRLELLLSLLKSLFNYRRDSPPLQASPACMTLILTQGRRNTASTLRRLLIS